MLNSNHPDDERLSALAAADPDASADASLTAHIGGCERCADVVRELGALRFALSDLPDIAPPRPLRLLPPVEADAVSGPDRLGQWARRLFAPALTAGAALAMVGVVGTALPGLAGLASSGGQDAGGTDTAAAEAADAAGAAEEDPTLEFALPSGFGEDGAGNGQPTTLGVEDEDEDEAAQREVLRSDSDALSEERSPWPMVLFSGVALMIAAALLRWILVPRAG